MKITKNNKKILFVLLILATLFSLSGCGDDETIETPSPSINEQSTPSPRPAHTPTPLQVSNTSDLCGQWEQFDSEFPGLHQVAIISGDMIEIYWVNEETYTQYLYWSGSFPASDPIESPYTWASKNNMERTELSPLASWAETKAFTFEDGQIRYSASSVGITSTVRLEMNTWNPDLATDVFFENDTFSFSVADIEFSIPDFFPENAEKVADGAMQFTLSHGSSGCALTFWEYRATRQEFDEKKENVIKAYMGEDADRVESHDITVASFSGTAFSYHIVNQNNVSLNVYGALVHNPRLEEAVLFALTMPRKENYQKFFDKIIAERATLLNGDLYSETMGYDIAIVYGAGPTLRVAYFFDFDKGIMTQMYIHNKYHSSEYTGTDHIYTVEIGGDLESGWYTYPNGDAHNYYELVVEEDGTERIYYYNSRHDLLDTYRVSSVEDWIFYLRDGLSGKSEKTQEGLLTPDKK